MVSLRLAGALEQCATFPSSVDFGKVANLRMSTPALREYTQDNLNMARRVGDWKMVLALRSALRPRPFLGLRSRLGRLRRAMRRGRAPPDDRSLTPATDVG